MRVGVTRGARQLVEVKLSLAAILRAEGFVTLEARGRDVSSGQTEGKLLMASKRE